MSYESAVTSEEMNAYFEQSTDAENIKINEPMDRHVTFKAGGQTAFFLTPATEEEALSLIQSCVHNGFPFMVIGNGSNLLVKDEGYKGALICLKKLNAVFVKEDGTMHCGAGATLAKAANTALDSELTGLEFASGIPGTVGGGAYMNAGAYGGEISDVLTSVKAVLATRAGSVSKAAGMTVKTLSRADLAFSYRKSAASAGGLYMLSAEFKLQKSDYVTIKSQMMDLNNKRAEKQPLDLPSAGSAFKRPPGHFAARLIEDAGLKGFRIGGAQVSEKHAGFIVNQGGATARDILNLTARVQETVLNKFGVSLEPEFCII